MIKVEEIVTPSDLTHASYGCSARKIQQAVNADFNPDKKLVWELRVNSLHLPLAITMAYIVSCQCEIDFKYHEDEWSLTGYYYDTTTREREGLEIHSPGA